MTRHPAAGRRRLLPGSYAAEAEPAGPGWLGLANEASEVISANLARIARLKLPGQAQRSFCAVGGAGPGSEKAPGSPGGVLTSRGDDWMSETRVVADSAWAFTTGPPRQTTSRPGPAASRPAGHQQENDHNPDKEITR